MFKPSKALSVKESRALSGKDVKTLRKKIETQFNLEESVLNALLPPKAEVTLLKLSNRSCAWAVAGQPLLFDPDGRGAGPLLPSVYLLWAAVRASAPASDSSPPLLPEVFTFSEVSPKVLGGADLFLQGFLPGRDGGGPPPGLEAGAPAAVRVEGNPFPFAVGTMEVSSEGAVAGGMKGKGLRLLHHAFDALWSLGDKSAPAGFSPSRVFPTSGEAAPSAPDASTSASVAPAAAQPVEEKEEEAQEKKEEDDGEGASAGLAALGLSAADPPSASSSNPPFFPADLDLSSTAGQDAVAECCLLAACASVVPSALPMLTSDFQKEMARARPAACPALDLKRTSFKQLSKLLKRYEKLGVLGTRVLRKQDMVSAVDAGHALVAEFLAKGGGVGGGGGGETPSAAGEEGAKPSSSSAAVPRSSLTIEPAYRVSPSLRPVFAGPGAPPAPAGDFYSEADVKTALASYLAAEKLLLPPDEGTKPSSASVDRLLLAALFNKGSDRDRIAEGDEKSLLPVGELEERLLSRLTKYTRVRRSCPASPAADAAASAAAAGTCPPPPAAAPSFEEKVFRGPLKKISIAVEDRQGGRKHVTRVWGVERYALSPEALASTLQKRFKTSASVSRVSAEEEEVALQGDSVRQLVLFLGSEYGIGSAHIDVKTKGGR